MVARPAHDRLVPGSSPGGPTTKYASLRTLVGFPIADEVAEDAPYTGDEARSFDCRSCQLKVELHKWGYGGGKTVYFSIGGTPSISYSIAHS